MKIDRRKTTSKKSDVSPQSIGRSSVLAKTVFPTNNEYIYMRKLVINAAPLLQHNIREAQFSDLGAMFTVFCPKTAAEVVRFLTHKQLPAKIDWKYPEQILSPKMIAFVGSAVEEAKIEHVEILTTTIWWSCRIAFGQNVTEVVKGEVYSVNGFYGHQLMEEYLWAHCQ